MSIAYEIPQSWRRPDCSDLCWQRLVRLAQGYGGSQMLTHHDLDSHERAWRQELDDERTDIVTGPLLINRMLCTVAVDDRSVHITPTAFKILLHLAKHLDATCAADDIIADVWGHEWVAAGNYGTLLRTNIYRLRDALGPASTLVVTHPNLGFRLRGVDPCGSDEIPTDPQLRFVFREGRPRALLHPPMVRAGGPRQRALLELLRASPKHRRSLRDVVTTIWGEVSSTTRHSFQDTRRSLVRQGFSIYWEPTDEHGLGWVWMDEEAAP